MRGTGSACSLLLLLTMAAVSSGRNAREYFEEARFQYYPARPEDALVLYIVNAPPLICEPQKADESAMSGPLEADFYLSLPRSYSSYRCSFVGNGTKDSNLKVIEYILPRRYSNSGRWTRMFREREMYCTTNSQLPDEYFHMKVQRPHEDHPVRCRLLIDDSSFHLRFPGYPTIVCFTGNQPGRYHFKLPGIDDPFTCAFRVYSELPLGDTRTEERLYQTLISGLPSRVDGARPRLACYRHATSDGAAHFQLLLHGGHTYDCSFPDAAPRYLPQPQHTSQD